MRSIDYEVTRILTYYEVKFHIFYQRTAVEVAEIRAVSGQSGIRQELQRITHNRLSHSTMRTAYFTGDPALVSHLFWLSFYSTPAAAPQAPEFTAVFYPEEGTQRILDLQIRWPLTAEELAQYSRSLAEAAEALLVAAPPSDTGYTVQDLARLVRDTVSYDPSGSPTALSALTGDPTNDLGVLLALEHLCQLQGLEISAVSDTSGTQMWLIVATPSGYRHLLPRDLRPDPAQDELEEVDPAADEQPTQASEPEEAELWQLPLYTDEELSALGFEWPRELHPACVDYSGARPE